MTAPSATTRPAQPPGLPAGVASIAVLPFKPLVPEGRDAALELGMADSLIMKLGSLRQITVRPLSAVRGSTDVDAGRCEGWSRNCPYRGYGSRRSHPEAAGSDQSEREVSVAFAMDSSYGLIGSTSSGRASSLPKTWSHNGSLWHWLSR